MASWWRCGSVTDGLARRFFQASFKLCRRNAGDLRSTLVRIWEGIRLLLDKAGSVDITAPCECAAEDRLLLPGEPSPILAREHE